MNRALLDDLQRRRSYPSITLLLNTTPGQPYDHQEQRRARALAQRAEQRLTGDVAPALAASLLGQLNDLIGEAAGRCSTGQAAAFCVSPERAVAVPLGRKVTERLIIDDTFATRDLVADANRTAMYRVVTISEGKVRVLIGDRHRLVEERGGLWPLTRDSESAATWAREVSRRLAGEDAGWPLPTVLAGVQRTLRRCLLADRVQTIGQVPGNHDRTSWAQLHTMAWPLVADWLRGEEERALRDLDLARSAHLYANGLDEIWLLANEGRVKTLVVEDTFAVPARISGGRIELTDEREAPDVVDDIVDDLIEAVLLCEGTAVIVPDGHLQTHGRLAAVLRY